MTHPPEGSITVPMFLVKYLAEVDPRVWGQQIQVYHTNSSKKYHGSFSTCTQWLLAVNSAWIAQSKASSRRNGGMAEWRRQWGSIKVIAGMHAYFTTHSKPIKLLGTPTPALTRSDRCGVKHQLSTISSHLQLYITGDSLSVHLWLSLHNINCWCKIIRM